MRGSEHFCAVQTSGAVESFDLRRLAGDFAGNLSGMQALVRNVAAELPHHVRTARGLLDAERLSGLEHAAVLMARVCESLLASDSAEEAHMLAACCARRDVSASRAAFMRLEDALESFVHDLHRVASAES